MTFKKMRLKMKTGRKILDFKYLKEKYEWVLSFMVNRGEEI